MMARPFYTRMKQNPNGTYNLTNLDPAEIRCIFRSLEQMENTADNHGDNFDNQINCARKLMDIIKTTPKNFELYKTEDII